MADAAPIDITTQEALKHHGFQGFLTVKELQLDPKQVPDEPGIFIIGHNLQKPRFIQAGTGGFMEKRSPELPAPVLMDQWVDEAYILYMDQADLSLRSAITHFLNPHATEQQGAYLWQLAYSSELVVSWKPFPKDQVKTVLEELLSRFKTEYGMIPFANLT